MAIDKNGFGPIYTLDTSGTTNITSNVGDIFYDTNQNTMYYTTSTGTLSTITIDSLSSPTYTTRTNAWDTYNDYFKNLKEFEHTMPDLTKIKEMCNMYPAMDKAFENFKAIYDLVKDDYEARKNNDT